MRTRTLSNLAFAVALYACANLAVGCADVVDGGVDAGGGGGGMGGDGGMGGTPLTCSDEGKQCGSDIGECVAGVVECDGTSSVCAGEIGPTQEVCDGLDNDCDGYIDEGLGTISPEATGAGFGNVEEMEAIGDHFALVGRFDGGDRLYKIDSAGGLPGSEMIADGNTTYPDIVPLAGEDVLVTRSVIDASAIAMIEARRASFAGANPVFLGSDWTTIKDTGLASFGSGNTRAARTDGSHVAVAFALVRDPVNPGGVRFLDTPRLPTDAADGPIASDVDSPFEIDLVAPADPNAPLIFAYKKSGEIRLVQLDRNDLGPAIDISIAPGSFPHLAASTGDKVALAFKSSTDRLSFVVFNANTLQCVPSPGPLTESCVTDTGAAASEITDLAFNGQHWFAAFSTPGGWGLRGLADDGHQVASHADSSAGAPTSVVLASKGDGSVMVAYDVSDIGFNTRIFECN